MALPLISLFYILLLKNQPQMSSSNHQQVVTAKMAGIHALSNELLKDVLDYIESDPEISVSIDRRAYLSVESFRPPSPPLPSRAQDVGNFRLVCSRFAELGAPYQWTRVATRLSPSGLRRLDRICSRSNLAKHTRKFSYLVPFFYGEGTVSCSLGRLGPRLTEAKAEST